MTEIHINKTPDSDPPEHRLRVVAKRVVMLEMSVTATAGEDAVDYLLRQATGRLRVFDQPVPRHYLYGDEERELPPGIRNPWGPWEPNDMDAHRP